VLHDNLLHDNLLHDNLRYHTSLPSNEQEPGLILYLQPALDNGNTITKTKRKLGTGEFPQLDSLHEEKQITTKVTRRWKRRRQVPDREFRFSIVLALALALALRPLSRLSLQPQLFRAASVGPEGAWQCLGQFCRWGVVVVHRKPGPGQSKHIQR